MEDVERRQVAWGAFWGRGRHGQWRLCFAVVAVAVAVAAVDSWSDASAAKKQIGSAILLASTYINSVRPIYWLLDAWLGVALMKDDLEVYLH